MRNIRIPQVFTLIPNFMYTNVTATTPVTFFLHLNKFFGGNKKEKRLDSYSNLFEPLVGFEPTTPRLQITCSGQLS